MKNDRRHLKRWFGFWALVVLLGHMPGINSGFVNLEYAFNEGARSLAQPTYVDGFKRYFHVEANPLGYSWIASFFIRFASAPNAFWPARVPSVLGALLLLTAGWIAARQEEVSSRTFCLWAATTMLSPLIWLYAGQATADVLPVGFLALAVVCCRWAGLNWLSHIVGGVLFSLAVLVKYNLAFTGIAFIFILATTQHTRPGERLRRKLVCVAWYTLLPIVVLLVYQYISWIYFGVWIVPEKFRARHSLSAFASSFPVILPLYIEFLVIMAGFLSLIPVIRIPKKGLSWTAALFGFVLIAFSGYLWVSKARIGEMDFGTFDQWLRPAVVQLFSVVALLLGGVMFLDLAARIGLITTNNLTPLNSRKRAAFILALILSYLCAVALFRPVQRYLIPLLPFLLWDLCCNDRPDVQRRAHILGWSSVAVFVVINVVGTAHLVSLGDSSERMARWIEQHQLEDVTDPADINPHARQHFPAGDLPNARYVVVSTKPSRFLHSEPQIVFGHEVRTFYLMEKP